MYEQLIEERQIKEEINYIESSEFTSNNLLRYLELLNVENSDIIVKQAILETGWFNSSSFKRGNNLFGMTVPKVRENLVKGSYLDHARYDHWTDSVKDYILWQQYWVSKGKNINNYYVFLEEINYATSSNYTHTLKRIDLNKLC